MPHLADEARSGPLVVHALPASDGDGVVFALLRSEAFKETLRSLDVDGHVSGGDMANGREST